MIQNICVIKCHIYVIKRQILYLGRYIQRKYTFQIWSIWIYHGMRRWCHVHISVSMLKRCNGSGLEAAEDQKLKIQQLIIFPHAQIFRIASCYRFSQLLVFHEVASSSVNLHSTLHCSSQPPPRKSIEHLVDQMLILAVPSGKNFFLIEKCHI